MARFKPFIWLVIIEVAALVLVLGAAYFQLPIGCPFKMLTGVPCPRHTRIDRVAARTFHRSDHDQSAFYRGDHFRTHRTHMVVY